MQKDTIAQAMMKSVACHESVHTQEKHAVSRGPMHNK